MLRKYKDNLIMNIKKNIMVGLYLYKIFIHINY